MANNRIEIAFTVLSLGGWGAAATYMGAAATYIGAAATYMGAAATYMGGGWGKVEINAISAQHSWNWA